LIPLARLGLKLYVGVFVLAGLYASLLLLAAMRGLHNDRNTIIFGCGILFIVRAFFASRAGIWRIREFAVPEPAALAWVVSDTVFAIGDLIAVISLALTAWAFWTNQNRLDAPVAPFGIGIAAAYPLYFAAAFRRLRHEWAGT
jgi:hypothetical protein